MKLPVKKHSYVSTTAGLNVKRVSDAMYAFVKFRKIGFGVIDDKIR